jgi:DNA-binding NarL/FixJ family response regulator
MKPVVAVVAHVEAMAAEGIAAALRSYPSLAPIAVSSAEAAVLRGRRADVVALDDRLPGADRAAARLLAAGVRVVHLSEEEDEYGPVRVSPRARIAHLAMALAPGAGNGKGSLRLTPRETEILDLVSRGLAAKQVARQLGISPKTVEQHKSRIFTKLGVPNQAAAVGVALGLERSHA